MLHQCEKLPSRLEWNMFGGDAKLYKERLYQIFKRDFIDNELWYKGKKVDIIHESYFEGKERSFWHMISEGDEDASRKLSTERCASLPYAKPLIIDDGACSDYKTWIKWHDKTNKYRHYLWCAAVNYMVILEDRKTYFKLISAYNVFPSMVKSYEKQFQKYQKTKTPTR